MPKLGVAFVGCGRISDLHAIGYRGHPDAELRAVYDADPVAAGRKASEWGVASVADSFEALLSDPGIDAVEILTPQDSHESIAIAALRAGKHVSVQKPMATNLKSADRMIRAAKEAGRVLKVSENYVHYPPIALARRLIEDGAIGEPLVFRAKLISGGYGGWEVPASAWAWRVKEYADGRGMNTFDHGHHMWATAWHLLGRIEGVSAWIDSVDGFVDSPAVVNLRFEKSHRLGQCEFHYGKALEIPSKYYANDEWFDVSGSEGLLCVRRCTGTIKQGPALAVFSKSSWSEHEAKSDWSEGFAGSSRNFIDSILGRAKALPDAEEARHLLAVDLAVSRSDRLGRIVWVDEMDSMVPAVYALGKRFHIAREKRAWSSRIKGQACGESDAEPCPDAEAAARRLTLGLADRFSPEAAGGFDGAFSIELEGVNFSLFAVRVRGRGVEVLEGPLEEKPLFTIRAKASSWASILEGKSSLESAFLKGSLKLEGGLTKALRLREMFKI